MATDFAALGTAPNADVRNYIAEATLSIALKETKFHQFGAKARLPNRMGKTFTATRYERMALPQAPLVDGQTPATPVDLTISQVNCVADQWGMFVVITDVAELTIAHSPFQKAMDLLGYNQAELVDREIQKTLIAGTNVFYGDVATVLTRATVTPSMLPLDSVFRRIVASLRTYGARGMEKPEADSGGEGGSVSGSMDPESGDLFVCVVDPSIEMDIVAMSGFETWKKYTDPEKAWNGEIGSLYGIRFVRSNFIPVILGAAAPAISASDTGGALTVGVHYYRVAYINNKTGVEDKLDLISLTGTIGAVTAGSNTLTVVADADRSYCNVYGTIAGAANTTPAYFIGKFLTSSVVVTAEAVNTAAVAPPAVYSAATSLHTLYFIGKEAYTVVDLQDLETYITPATASDSDPLVQRRKVGWKRMFKSVINNQNFMARLEIESAHD